ncbi:hypothetical protein CDN99_22320 [Roseateles aquatilis]|uniref:Peptidase S1 domain-containing protein n=2 Tax=Roseateles aquatilis TaxID=431061 RepID=A0A2D0AM32_9BURK|nr:hypothetical protein CDN99_22320 [Roseateles aquatilis]
MLGLAMTCGANADPNPEADVPLWAFGNGSCAGTLLTSRVVLSHAACFAELGVAGSGEPPTFKPRGDMKQIRTGTTHPGKVVQDSLDAAKVLRADPAPLASLLLDEPVRAPKAGDAGNRKEKRFVRIPTYRFEQRLLRDVPLSATTGADAPTLGTRLSFYRGSFNTYGATAYRHATYDYYWDVALDERGWGFVDRSSLSERPLVYRSVSRIRQQEPERFIGDVPRLTRSSGRATSPPTSEEKEGVRSLLSRYHLGGLLRAQFGTPVMPDRAVDDRVIAIVGMGKDRTPVHLRPHRGSITGTYGVRVMPPFQSGDNGAGLLAWHDKSGKDLLVGVVSGGAALHSRMSAHWPWVYRMLMKDGLSNDARLLAKQVLGARSEDCPSAKFGELCFRVAEAGQAPAFFRRVAETGASLPVDGLDGEDWEYLGTELPDRHAATRRVSAWDSADASQAPKPGATYVRFNGKSRVVEYFQRKTSVRAQPMDELPLDGQGNNDWLYLGTDLPSVHGRALVDTEPDDIALTPPGIAPALPASAATP